MKNSRTHQMKRKKSHRRKRVIIAIVAAAVAVVVGVVAIVLIHKSSAPTRAVVEIDGNPVYEEEFSLLLKDHMLQYEATLRDHLSVPDGQDLCAYLNGDEEEYRRLILQAHVQTLVQLRVETALAEEYGVLEKPFTYEYLQQKLVEENEERQRKLANGEVVYGLKKFDMVTYYDYFMSGLVTDTIRRIPDAVLQVDDAMVDEYYQNKTTSAFVDGERQRYVIYDLSAIQTESENLIAGAKAAVQAELSSGGSREVQYQGYTFNGEQVLWSNDDIRGMVRRGRNVEAALLCLEAGQVSDLFYTGEKWLVVRYDGVEKTAQLQESDRNALKEELRESAYRELVNQRMAKVDVKLNEKEATRIFELMN